MTNVVHFPSGDVRSLTELERIIRNELRSQGASENLVSDVLERMRSFMKLLIFSFDIHGLDVSEELTKQFGELSAALSQRTNELLMERLLAELKR